MCVGAVNDLSELNDSVCTLFYFSSPHWAQFDFYQESLPQLPILICFLSSMYLRELGARMCKGTQCLLQSSRRQQVNLPVLLPS